VWLLASDNELALQACTALGITSIARVSAGSISPPAQAMAVSAHQTVIVALVCGATMSAASRLLMTCVFGLVGSTLAM